MAGHRVVSHSDWCAARLELLETEKRFTRERDALTQKRMAMPWEPVEKDYRFQTATGEAALADLFAGKSQLIVYHFMLGPDWNEGCKSCSFWADNFNNVPVHLAHRDVAFSAVSRAPLERIEAYKRRMGWTFTWVSSFDSDFNFDFQVSVTPEQLSAGEAVHNYALRQNTMSELAGISVFARDDAGRVFHTYSTYARGLDMVNGAYHLLDLVPKGRDEDGLSHMMDWVRRHDQYED